MIDLPDPEEAFRWENSFYLTASPMRLGKLLAQWEIFKRIIGLPGAVVECGVFKGCSLARLAMFRALCSTPHSKPIVAFDTFDRYAQADTPRDETLRARMVRDAGEDGISCGQMMGVLEEKECAPNVTLCAGDIRETVPKYVRDHPELKIALLNLDVDFQEAAETVLEHLYPRLVTGGILMLDDYGVFEGETIAADNYFKGKVKIERFPYAYSPSYLVKPW